MYNIDTNEHKYAHLKNSPLKKNGKYAGLKNLIQIEKHAVLVLLVLFNEY